MNKVVLFAKLHDGIDFLPGVGSIGNTLPSQSKTLDNLKMHTDGLMLYVNFTYRGIKKYTGIPVAAVKIMDFAADVEASFTIPSGTDVAKLSA